MTARTSRPSLEALEDRCTPSTVSFTVALGGGHSAVSLLVNVQTPPNPIAPGVVTIRRVLPNGVVQARPPTPIAPPNRLIPPTPIHDLIPPTPIRGLLQAADVSSSVFIVPITTGAGGVTRERKAKNKRPVRRRTARCLVGLLRLARDVQHSPGRWRSLTSEM
jgi:hypothetical protein